jgi:thiamine biosynthesis protein ThiS
MQATEKNGMELVVNGEPREVVARTVLDLLEELRLQPARMVVEQNGVIVQRNAYGDTLLGEGDILELVRIVGGG